METDNFPIPGLERPGLQKSSISGKFLLKIDDFRRRVDWEKPGTPPYPSFPILCLPFTLLPSSPLLSLFPVLPPPFFSFPLLPPPFPFLPLISITFPLLSRRR